MRLCRFRHHDRSQAGFYDEKFIIPLAAAVKAYGDATHDKLELAGDDLIELLPGGKNHSAAVKLGGWIGRMADSIHMSIGLATDKVELLVPVPRPNKLFLLAGNYASHIQEGG